MSKIEGQYRQGDVLLSRIGTVGSHFAALPEGLTIRPTEPDGSVVLARGDSTGNPHFFASDAQESVSANGDRFIHVAVTVPLRCPSHTWHTIPADDYELTIQREWSDSDEPRPVID